MSVTISFSVPGTRTGHARIFIDGERAATTAVTLDRDRTTGELSYKVGAGETARRGINDMIFAIARGNHLEFSVDDGPRYPVSLKGSSKISGCEAVI